MTRTPDLLLKILTLLGIAMAVARRALTRAPSI